MHIATEIEMYRNINRNWNIWSHSPQVTKSHQLPFRCYVAEDLATRFLVGYVLFFNTLDERAVSGGRSGAACYTDDPVAVVEDLYVEPDYRAKGIATQLFRKVLQVRRMNDSVWRTKNSSLSFLQAASDIFNGPLIMACNLSPALHMGGCELNRLSPFQSSLERGCLSLECLILNSHSEGVSFWKRMLGERRIEAVMRRSRLHWKRRRMRERLRLEPLKRGHCAVAGSTRDETVVELDRCDMKKLLEGTDREGGGGGSGSSDHVDSEMCTRNREFEDRDHNGRKILVAKRRPKTLATEATDNIS